MLIAGLGGTAATNFYRTAFAIWEIAGTLGCSEDRVDRLIDTLCGGTRSCSTEFEPGERAEIVLGGANSALIDSCSEGAEYTAMPKNGLQ